MIKPINQLTIAAAREGLKEKRFTAVELVQACLEQIEKWDKKIEAFITVVAQEALKEAKQADELIKRGPEVFREKPLLGIPFDMKDVYATKGIQTTAGSKVLQGYRPQYNATVYQRLLDAGAILLGKTNCDAWGHGISTENSDYFVTRNPWDLERVAGGSSGGGAAALAAGMTLFSIGEDTGGSIRQPASFCGISGLKVSYGRVSRYGSIAYASSLDTVGPMAKTVADLALVLSVIAGQDQRDASSAHQAAPDYAQELTKKKKATLGIPQEFFGQGLDSEVKKVVLQAVKDLEKASFKTVNVKIPMLKYAIPVYYILACSETSSNLARYDGVRYGHSRNAFGDEAKRRIMLGTYALSAGYYDQYYLQAQKARTLIIQDYQKAFKKCDCLIAPVSPTPAFKLGEKQADPLAAYLADIYTCTINVAGLPSLALPGGFSNQGLPIGFQLIGPQFSESHLLQVGYAYEQMTKWFQKRPKLGGEK